ncbi:hypothetical protein PoB_000780900 [Plakobranchus ocellatus]|uniref:Uncharacterized protein n=1 Tax=Plakobranchus ocellatus TaxID=259542 RepID=A0AAV3YG80_9GAST|nr:hypothetical protein PoB_000780900 [Plakobranchus ocellatus]
MGYQDLQAYIHVCGVRQTRDMQKDQLTGSMLEKRSFNSMKENLTQFLASGGGEKSTKHFKNVIHPAMLDTELDAVAPPYLHILLGIVGKHHSHMERDAAILDQKLLDQRAKLLNLSKKYEKYGMRLEEALPFVNEKKKFLETCIVFSDEFNKKEVRQWTKRLQTIQEILEEIKENKFKDKGPLLRPCSQF